MLVELTLGGAYFRMVLVANQIYSLVLLSHSYFQIMVLIQISLSHEGAFLMQIQIKLLN